MNKRRLLKLADLLEADAKNRNGVRFDLETFGSTKNVKKFVEPNCGTVACAVGLACVSGAFKRSGLDFDVDGDGEIIPSFNGMNGCWASENFFELSTDEFDFLFVDDSYPKEFRKGAKGERYVAKRIRDFVAGKVAP
jgi:hypothetical protein